MKTIAKCLLVFAITTVMAFSTKVSAQDDTTSMVSFNSGLDLYSNYMWRGTKFGTGPAFQPTVSMKAGSFTLGSWGSFDAAGYCEADLYASYAFEFGLTVGATDYYYPTAKDTTGIYVASKYFDYDKASSFHVFEANLGYTFKQFSISANYILNEAGGALSIGGDKYFEASYAFSKASLFVGAGDGWHTSTGDFAVCNVGVKTTKVIKVTDDFSIPVTGMVVLNPEKEYFTMAVGLTF